MTNLEPLLKRNRAYAATAGGTALPPFPRFRTFLVTCLDPRVEPAALLGLELGDAMVVRNAGGRVTDTVVADIAFIGFMAEQMIPDGPIFEVAIIHHTGCGTALLDDAKTRADYATRTGYDDADLAAMAVTDPEGTVRADVARLLAAPPVSERMSVSGHVLDLATGLVGTVVAPTAPVPSAGVAR